MILTFSYLPLQSTTMVSTSMTRITLIEERRFEFNKASFNPRELRWDRSRFSSRFHFEFFWSVSKHLKPYSCINNMAKKVKRQHWSTSSRLLLDLVEIMPGDILKK